MLYETHIAADLIDEFTKSIFLDAGFKSNEFIRHREVSASAWRATWKSNKKRTQKEWNDWANILKSSSFQGTLIEELFDTATLNVFSGSAKRKRIAPPPSLVATNVPPGEYKACDIHISIDLTRSDPASVSEIERICNASVDRKPKGSKRIFTVTCERLLDGHAICEQLSSHLETLESLYGKIYLEQILRYERIPNNTPVLKRVDSKHAADWLHHTLTNFTKPI